MATALETVGFKRAIYDVDHKFGDAKMPRISLSKRSWALVFEINKVAESYQKFTDIPNQVAAEIEHLIGEELRTMGSFGDVHDDHPLGHDSIHPYIKKIVFKDAKFIFLERPMDEYLESVRKHVLNKRYKHIFGHCRYIFCKDCCLGNIITSENYKKWKLNHLELKRVFPNDVLIMDLEDGWSPLASFLGFEIPKVNFPWTNRSHGFLDKCVNPTCGHKLNYSEKYDSEYCPVCLEWTDEKCIGEGCALCSSRPDKPSVTSEED